ncbi:Golgi SNAP receptor complex member 1-2 [Vitis vinifera]|uniref:Golgi SNAP receptor complex member 1-2 n=1 Tax=Vitis vinifera TaxID=29760 RepID=A0A438IW83_VITVI|nr:Golgi SNAP receptor complex member 1-2 [Vitis vinifera]
MMDPNLDLQESGWEELRKEARKIEGDLDVKLSSYAKLGARFTQGAIKLGLKIVAWEFKYEIGMENYGKHEGEVAGIRGHEVGIKWNRIHGVVELWNHLSFPYFGPYRDGMKS